MYHHFKLLLASIASTYVFDFTQRLPPVVYHSFAYSFYYVHRGENCVWSGEKILNSCDGTLCDKLIESTHGWDTKFKGGSTYFKLLMGLIVATSKKSSYSLLNKIVQLKFTDFNGEDVNEDISFLKGATRILKDNNTLPNDFILLISSSTHLCKLRLPTCK